MALFKKFLSTSATPATAATLPGDFLPTVASVATVAEDKEKIFIEEMEAEYFRLLRRHWELDEQGPDASMDECRENVIQLDRLYRELHRQGRKVPVRLPVERKEHMTQEELAL